MRRGTDSGTSDLPSTRNEKIGQRVWPRSVIRTPLGCQMIHGAQIGGYARQDIALQAGSERNRGEDQPSPTPQRML
jgi:hypothetical protein